MSWANFFKPGHSHPGESDEIEPLVIQEAKVKPQTPEEILLQNGFKIKSRILTDFGTQFELFKKIDSETIKELHQFGQVLQKGNFIFI